MLLVRIAVVAGLVGQVASPTVESQASKTAVYVAIARAIGAKNPDVELRNPDDFAIKFLLKEFASNDEAYNRFVREAETTGKLQHPSIVDVFDVAQTVDGRPFIVMELLVGEGLDDRLKREGSLAPMECFVDDRHDDGRVLCSHHDDSGRGCATKLLWTRVQIGVLKTLAHTTLAELVDFHARQLPRERERPATPASV